MLRTYAEREVDYRRRLRVISPIAVAATAVLFVAGELVPRETLRRYTGWEGEMRIVPNITIIPDNDPYEDMREKSAIRMMASRDVNVLEETGPAEGPPAPQAPVPESQPLASSDRDLDEIRHYPAHTQVPYSEHYVILHWVQPEYPLAELLDGIEGEVTVEVLVNETGGVENVWVLSAVGPKSFERSILDAVGQFRFKPPVEGGKPVPMWIRYHARFDLID
jgi:TonB family protein